MTKDEALSRDKRWSPENDKRWVLVARGMHTEQAARRIWQQNVRSKRGEIKVSLHTPRVKGVGTKLEIRIQVQVEENLARRLTEL